MTHLDGTGPPWVEPRVRLQVDRTAAAEQKDVTEERPETSSTVVARPSLPGGGGSSDGWYDGGPGGGVIEVTAGELVVNGELRAAEPGTTGFQWVQRGGRHDFRDGAADLWSGRDWAHPKEAPIRVAGFGH